MSQARSIFRLPRANGLGKPSNGLASRKCRSLAKLIPKHNIGGRRHYFNRKMRRSLQKTSQKSPSPTQARLSDGIRQTGLCSTCQSISKRFPSLCTEILYQISLSQLKHRFWVVNYAPDTRYRYEHYRGQDQAQARFSDAIRQTGLRSTMASHSRACAFVNSRIYCYTRAASKSCVTPAFEYSCSRMAQNEFGTAICSVFSPCFLCWNGLETAQGYLYMIVW
jgi:hypothetical protein